MTLEEFVRTRRWSDDLGTALDEARWNGEPKATGYLYLDVLYIDAVQDHWPEHAKADGKWHLLLDRNEWITDDLRLLEGKLWEYAKEQGYFD